MNRDERSTLGKQALRYKHEIGKLKNETTKLKEQLNLDSLHATNASSNTQLSRLQSEGDALIRKIEIEKKRQEEIDYAIAMTQEKLARQKEEEVKAAKENKEAMMRKIKGLKVKKDKALTKYNEAIAVNRQLRSQIDNMRRERVVYDNIYKKLEIDLSQKKAELHAIILKSKDATEACQQAREKMNKLKQDAGNEQEKFEQEWKELGRLIEQDRKIKDFIKEQDDEGDVQMNAPELAEDDELKKKNARSNIQMCKEKITAYLTLEKVRNFEESFEKIQAATGIMDIQELVETFVNAKQQNKSYKGKVDELTNEIEGLEQEIGSIKFEIDKFKGKGDAVENQRKKILNEMEEKLQETENRAVRFKENYKNIVKTIEIMKQGIHAILEKLDLNEHNIDAMALNENNMVRYLGSIESRTNEILQMYSACQAAPSSEVQHFTTRSGHTTLVYNPEGVIIEPPSFLDEPGDEEEDEATLPLTTQELQEKAKKKIDYQNSKKKKA